MVNKDCHICLSVLHDRFSWWPDGQGSERFAWIYAAKEISEALSIANYAVNFFLYCVSGSAFRHHVRKIAALMCRVCGGAAARRSLLDSASFATSCTSAASRHSASPAYRHSASPASRHSASPMRLEPRPRNDDGGGDGDSNVIVRLTD